MPVEKATTAEDLPMGQMLDIEIDAEEEMPDVEIEFDPEGGVVVNIGEDDDAEVPYDANLAEVVPDDVLSEMALRCLCFLTQTSLLVPHGKISTARVWSCWVFQWKSAQSHLRARVACTTHCCPKALSSSSHRH